MEKKEIKQNNLVDKEFLKIDALSTFVYSVFWVAFYFTHFGNFHELKLVFWELSSQNIYDKKGLQTGFPKSTWLPNVNINCCLLHLSVSCISHFTVIIESISLWSIRFNSLYKEYIHFNEWMNECVYSLKLITFINENNFCHNI